MRRASSALVVLVLASSLGCTEDYCLVTEYALSDDDLVWDKPLPEVVAKLQGPFEGTWTWEDGDGIVEVPEAGTSIPATAHVELDPDSYRFVETEFVDGNRIELFPERLAICLSEEAGFHADGVMTVVDEHGDTLAIFPLQIWQYWENSLYTAEARLEPGSIFAEPLHLLESFDEETLLIDVTWNWVEGPVHVDIYFAGRLILPDTPEGHSAGALAWADIATFEVPWE